VTNAQMAFTPLLGAPWFPRISSTAFGCIVARVEPSAGGRVTLRLVTSDAERAEYAGEIIAGDLTWASRARVSVPDGAIELSHDRDDPPEWLVSIARSALRVAWRGTRAGASFPRRINRWRPGPGAGADE
jgi:hypothetical protein